MFSVLLGDRTKKNIIQLIDLYKVCVYIYIYISRNRFTVTKVYMDHYKTGTHTCKTKITEQRNIRFLWCVGTGW